MAVASDVVSAAQAVIGDATGDPAGWLQDLFASLDALDEVGGGNRDLSGLVAYARASGRWRGSAAPGTVMFNGDTLGVVVGVDIKARTVEVVTVDAAKVATASWAYTAEARFWQPAWGSPYVAPAQAAQTPAAPAGPDPSKSAQSAAAPAQTAQAAAGGPDAVTAAEAELAKAEADLKAAEAAQGKP